MFETYRMLGREREAELESEAARLRPLAGRPINWIPVVIVAVIVAALALGATIARAQVGPEGRTGAQVTIQPAPPDLIERWVASHKTPASGPPDLIERWVASHQHHVSQVPPANSSNAGDGFDWSAALVGASTVAALVLALALAFGIARRFRMRSAAT